jgi:AraC family transcriptional regulator
MELGGLDPGGLARVKAYPAVRLLFEGRELAVGEFHCSPGDPRWREENCTDEGHVVAFPGPPVVIHHAGRDPAVVSRNEVVLYNQGQTYRRQLLDPVGDHCVFLVVAPSLLSEISIAVGSGQEADRVAFSAHLGTVQPGTFLLQRAAISALHACSADPLRVEETLYRVAFDAAGIGLRRSGRERRSPRRGTRAAHTLVVEATKALLVRRLGQRISLTEIAREASVSPFHLVRIFRERTGFGVHQYRDHLRLRLALDRVVDGEVTLAALALELGYSSHSHFTDSFRRVFGLPPSAVRASPRALPELRERLPALSDPRPASSSPGSGQAAVC